MNYKVSVVIPTKNNELTIAKCLDSIRNQTYKNIETVVVDNNSTDKTRQIAARYTKKLFTKGPERSTQRNYGVEKSRGKYIAIIDSDMILSRQVIEQCVRVIEKKPIIKQVVIPERSVGTGFWSQVKAYERSFYVGDTDMEAARFFDRKAFIKTGGYDEKIRGGGEEYDLPERLLESGYKQARIQSFITHLEGKLTLLETIKTKYYYGQTAAIYFKKHPKKYQAKIKLIRPAFIRNWRRLVAHPVLTPALFVLKFCELSAGAVGAAITFASKKSL